MCEKNQLSFNYNKYDWILKKEASHEEKKESNKNKMKIKIIRKKLMIVIKNIIKIRYKL